MIPPTDRESMIRAACDAARDEGRSYGAMEALYMASTSVTVLADADLRTVAGGHMLPDWIPPTCGGECGEPGETDLAERHLPPHLRDDADARVAVAVAWQYAARAAWRSMLAAMAGALLPKGAR